jgi:hypothetical protein
MPGLYASLSSSGGPVNRRPLRLGGLTPGAACYLHQVSSRASRFTTPIHAVTRPAQIRPRHVMQYASPRGVEQYLRGVCSASRTDDHAEE